MPCTVNVAENPQLEDLSGGASTILSLNGHRIKLPSKYTSSPRVINVTLSPH